jgi:hypothetical protein
MKVNSRKFYNCTLLTLLYVLFYISYLFIISQAFSYEGYRANFLLYQFLIGIGIFMVILFLLLFLKIDGFFYSIVWLVLIFWIIPSLINFQLNFSKERLLLLILQLALFMVLVGLGALKFPELKKNKLDKRQGFYIIFILSLFLLIPFIVRYLPTINLKNLLLIDVYETRNKISEHSGFYTAYLYSPLAKISFPVLLVLSFELRKRFLTVIIFLSIIFLFLVGAHKTVLAGLIIVVLFYFKNYYDKIKWLLVALVTVTFLSLISFFLFEDVMLVSTFVRRPFFLPALLDIYYFDFFEDNFTYYSQSINRFKTFPFDLEIPRLIGSTYFNSETMGANNGLFSDGYANLGILGVVINIIFFTSVIIYFRVINISQRFFGIIFLMFFSFYSSSFFTVLLTHGVIFLMLIAPFILKASRDENRYI